MVFPHHPIPSPSLQEVIQDRIRPPTTVAFLEPTQTLCSTGPPVVFTSQVTEVIGPPSGGVVVPVDTVTDLLSTRIGT
jgi:hypothetical protein